MSIVKYTQQSTTVSFVRGPHGGGWSATLCGAMGNAHGRRAELNNTEG